MHQIIELARTYGLHLSVIVLAVAGALGVNAANLLLHADRNRQLADRGIVAVAEQKIEGPVTVLGGRLLRVGGSTVALLGIDAPEPYQRCRSRTGRFARCGEQVARTLSRMTRGQTVNCRVLAKGSDDRARAKCRLNGADIAAELVRRGLAHTVGTHDTDYADLQNGAKASKLGMWGGESETPAAFRARKWSSAARSRRDRCPIKGDVRRGERHYYLPWARHYSKISISRSRGERWFCSISEAEVAGWRQAAWL